MTENCDVCDVNKILEETAYLEKLQSEVEYGNAQVFRSFKIKIEMEEEMEEGREGGRFNLNGYHSTR